MERLGKILANTDRRSREEAREPVQAGRVAVDGVTAQAAGGKYGPTARFEVDGKTISGKQLAYLMLRKPTGLMFTTEDPRQPTVPELLLQHLRRVGFFPAGQLDKNTEGLLLPTNDGLLIHRLLVPRDHVDKTYFVRMDGGLDGADAAASAAGMMLGDGLTCLPVGLEALEQPNTTFITLHEGEYHQTRRMLVAWGEPVACLKWLIMRPLVLNLALGRGEWRPLSTEEVATLRQAQGRPGWRIFTVNLPSIAGHASALSQYHDFVCALPSPPSPRPLCFLSAFGSFNKKFCKAY